MMRNETVAAVVVTRNRIKLLQECVAALRSQTRRPDAIIVVDNGSTDGTADWLGQQTDLTVVTQGNLGSGGGQHAGMELACQRGHDWLWCMDDDGFPAPDCLERLLSVDDPSLLVRGVLVLDRDHRERLAFSYGRPGLGREMILKSEVLAESSQGLLRDYTTFFNGVLIHREVPGRVGFPNPGLFLWGDEIEYLHRIRAGGYPMAVNVAAEFYHPGDRVKLYPEHFLGKSFFIRCMDDPFRDYLLVRNYAYIARRYYGWSVGVNHILKYSIFHWRRGTARKIPGVWAAGLAGLAGSLKGHKRFL